MSPNCNSPSPLSGRADIGFIIRTQSHVYDAAGAPPADAGGPATLIRHFDALRADLRGVLEREMRLTGCVGQAYARGDGSSDPDVRGGPAILVYYAPAFLRSALSERPRGALAILAEVYRAARSLYPLSEASAATHVTVRVDQLKELSVAKITSLFATGECWVLLRQSDRDAVVERRPLDQIWGASDKEQTELLRVWDGALPEEATLEEEAVRRRCHWRTSGS